MKKTKMCKTKIESSSDITQFKNWLKDPKNLQDESHLTEFQVHYFPYSDSKNLELMKIKAKSENEARTLFHRQNLHGNIDFVSTVN
jgi:hypothetical protein